jgi:Ca2+-transporting ATPase
LDALQSAAMAREVEAMATQGLRVLAVARAVETHSGGILSPDSPMPAQAHDFAFEFLGLLGLADPLREGVPAAVAECLGAGIRVLMITGDHPATALAIARKAGIPSTNLLTGAAMDALDDLTLAQRLRDTCVVARATPMHKLRIVRALRAQGWVVGMTGDGINDAPALRAADVGVAMGRRGTDVAREAADLVLAEDDFGALVGAVREGRRIFDNLRSATAYLIAVHLPIAVLAMAPLLLGGPLMLMPAHIAFLELVIDPACALVFQALALSSQAMRQPPRAAQTGLFERAVLGRALTGGLLATLFCALVWWGAQGLGWREEDIRAATFASLVFGNLGLIVFYRGGVARPGLTFPLVCFGALAALAAVLTIAPLAHLFRVG